MKRRHQPMSRFYFSCSRIVGGWNDTSTARQECATTRFSLRAELQTDAAPMLLSFAGCQNSTALNSLHCSIRSKVEVKFAECVRFRYSSGSPALQQVRLLVRFSLRRLRFSLRTHTSVLLYSDTAVRCLGDNSIRLGRMDASRQNSTTTNACSMSYRYTGVVLYQALCGVQRQL